MAKRRYFVICVLALLGALAVLAPPAAALPAPPPTTAAPQGDTRGPAPAGKPGSTGYSTGKDAGPPQVSAAAEGASLAASGKADGTSTIGPQAGRGNTAPVQGNSNRGGSVDPAAARINQEFATVTGGKPEDCLAGQMLLIAQDARAIDPEKKQPGKLCIADKLSQVASKFASELAGAGLDDLPKDHRLPNGPKLEDRVREGLGAEDANAFLAENLHGFALEQLRGQENVREAARGWLESEGHRNNTLLTEVNRMGLGAARGPCPPKRGNGECTFFAQVFANLDDKRYPCVGAANGVSDEARGELKKVAEEGLKKGLEKSAQGGGGADGASVEAGPGGSGGDGGGGGGAQLGAGPMYGGGSAVPTTRSGGPGLGGPGQGGAYPQGGGGDGGGVRRRRSADSDLLSGDNTPASNQPQPQSQSTQVSAGGGTGYQTGNNADGRPDGPPQMAAPQVREGQQLTQPQSQEQNQNQGRSQDHSQGTGEPRDVNYSINIRNSTTVNRRVVQNSGGGNGGDGGQAAAAAAGGGANEQTGKPPVTVAGEPKTATATRTLEECKSMRAGFSAATGSPAMALVEFSRNCSKPLTDAKEPVFECANLAEIERSCKADPALQQVLSIVELTKKTCKATATDLADRAEEKEGQKVGITKDKKPNEKADKASKAQDGIDGKDGPGNRKEANGAKKADGLAGEPGVQSRTGYETTAPEGSTGKPNQGPPTNQLGLAAAPGRKNDTVPPHLATKPQQTQQQQLTADKSVEALNQQRQRGGTPYNVEPPAQASGAALRQQVSSRESTQVPSLAQPQPQPQDSSVSSGGDANQQSVQAAQRAAETASIGQASATAGARGAAPGQTATDGRRAMTGQPLDIQ